MAWIESYQGLSNPPKTVSIDQLIEQYTKGVTGLNNYRKTLATTDPDQRDEHEIITSMINDMRYSLIWIKTGRRPGNRRGAEKASIYRQREWLSDVQNLPLSDEERVRLVMILLTLSERERACFLLHMAHGLTQEEIADRLEVSRRTVRSAIDRAKSKVQRGLSS